MDCTGMLMLAFLQNVMVFRHCIIGGKVYRGDQDPSQDQTEHQDTERQHHAPEPAEEPPPLAGSSTSAAAISEQTPVGQLETFAPGVVKHFHDSMLQADIENSVHADPGSEQAAHARLLNGFFTVLSLCHTVLTVIDPETSKIEYKAQSPDEAALMQAAADVGYVFRGRDREIIKLQTPFSDELERYELLNILEFTSARKRMSVVVRKLADNDDRLFLLTKGADNVIFERLKPGADEIRTTTSRQLAEFASEGLRTLTFAYKVIPGEFLRSRMICN
jgi:phospholipid-translocating ATPase